MNLALIEQLFGSDEAIGVKVRLSKSIGVEEVISLAEYDKRFGHLDDKDMPCVESLMPDDSSAICCTNYARHIKSVLENLGYHVDVVGFENADNPTSLCAIEEYHPEGHDFAVINNRYLIDPWVRLVACVGDQIFYDLDDSIDKEKALRVYGPKNLWIPLPKK